MPNEALLTGRPERARWLVGVVVLAGFGLLVFLAVAFVSTFAWPRSGVGDADANLRVGRVADFTVDQPEFFQQGRFWLVRQPDDTFVAYSAADSFRGCTVLWRSDYEFTDPRDGVRKRGWYRDPCHGSVYDPEGTKVFGPSPRDLDTYPVDVTNRDVIVHAAKRHLMKGDARPDYQPFGPAGGGG